MNQLVRLDCFFLEIVYDAEEQGKKPETVTGQTPLAGDIRSDINICQLQQERVWKQFYLSA